MTGDLIRAPGDTGWLVTGFFTPDYRPLAERLAQGLEAVNAPYHLFAKEKGQARWRRITRFKPSIVLEAMDLYPSKSIVLLDVDSTVRGDLAPMVNFNGDVSAYPTARIKRRPFVRSRPKVQISTRSIVFKPTAAARRLAESWRRECEDPEGIYESWGCETQLMMATLRATGLAFCPMDVRWSARESTGAPADAVIVHDSEHARATVSWLEGWLKK